MARTKRIQTILLYVILTLGALVMILPFYWMARSNLRTANLAATELALLQLWPSPGESPIRPLLP